MEILGKIIAVVAIVAFTIYIVFQTISIVRQVIARRKEKKVSDNKPDTSDKSIKEVKQENDNYIDANN